MNSDDKTQLTPAKPVSSVLRRPGGHGEEPEPDPIPNSAVKLLRANGTLS
jgi:hypothetical protein